VRLKEKNKKFVRMSRIKVLRHSMGNVYAYFKCNHIL